MTIAVPRGSLMEASLAGQRVEATLADLEVLVGAARELCRAVSEMGNPSVLATGRAASLIVGAAAMSSQGGVRPAVLPSSGGTDRKVVIVEAVAVGKSVIEGAASQARRSGADWIGVWVWRAGARMSERRISADEVVFSSQSAL